MPSQAWPIKDGCGTPVLNTPPAAVVILGIPFHNVSFADTLEWVRRRVHSRRPAYIATANMDFVTQAWRDPELQRILLEADLVVADGIPIVWLSRLLGHPLKERVTGSDLVPMFAELAAREGFSLYGLGGAEGVAEKALNILQERHPGMRIAGFFSPPKADILDMDNAGILARLDAANPDILLVAFGGPKQEKWCNMHIRRWKVPVSIGIGGSLDFIAGAQKRAPRWVQRIALEWLWRMLSNPRRLFRRYVANIGFFFTAMTRLCWLRWGPVPSHVPAPDAMRTPSPANEALIRRVAFPGRGEDLDLETFRAACAEEDERSLLVDMGHRAWLDIRSLGEVLALSRRHRAEGRWFCLLVSSPRLANLLRFVRLDRYIAMAGDMPEALRLLASWQAGSRAGCVRMDGDGRLRVILPTELTAANQASFREEVDAVWNEAACADRVTGVAVDASGVSFLDSAALGFLVALRKRALPLPDGFSCAGFHGNARRTLMIARLESLFAEEPQRIGAPA